MEPNRRYTGIAILIPGYSVEDIPSDLNEEKATELLNAIAYAWHPSVIASADSIPHFRYADISNLMDAQQVLFVPRCSEEWMGHDWREQLQAGNGLLLHGPVERADWDSTIAQAFSSDSDPIDPSLVHDFLALGLSWFLVSSLSRRMHYFIDPDEARLSSSIHDAANAALLNDESHARKSLEIAFECLLETREQLFPMECSLIDLCLPGTASDGSDLVDAVTECPGINLLISPAELALMMELHTPLKASVEAATTDGTCCVVSGGWHELRSSLGSLATAYSDLSRTAESSHPASGIWGQKKYGLYHSLPHLLNLFDYRFAVHVALDDGLYPEREYGQFNWQGPGDASVAAASRLPVAIDSATAFLRLPERLAETMQQDAAATLTMARLPVLSSPWLKDLRRIHELCPLIGRFVTFTELADSLESSKETVRFQPGDYLAPWLIQASVLKTEWPVTGPADLYSARHEFERLACLTALAFILNPNDVADVPIDDLEMRLQDRENERIDPDTMSPPETQLAHLQRDTEFIDQATCLQAELLATKLPQGPDAGLLVINPLPFAREAVISWPPDLQPPAVSDSIVSTSSHHEDLVVRCKVPPGGFVQLAAAKAGEPYAPSVPSAGRPLAEEGLLRNQHFEVLLSDASGGIADVRFHGQRANRVSQQVAFRYEAARTVPATEDADERTTFYAQTVCRGMNILESDDGQATIESQCEVVDVPGGDVLLRFRQQTTVHRNTPRIGILICPDADSLCSVTGNPWMTYLACRFAWDNEAAAITRGLLGQASGFSGERFESPDYIEVADEDHRLLIVPHGRPYHRRSGPRMLDSLLLVEGQEIPVEGFRFTLEFDQPFPQRTVLDLMQPVVISRRTGIGNSAAWLLGLSAKNVQFGRVRAKSQSLQLVLYETEGRSARCKLRTARPPFTASVTKATGEIIEELEISESGIAVNFSPFEIKEVRLAF